MWIDMGHEQWNNVRSRLFINAEYEGNATWWEFTEFTGWVLSIFHCCFCLIDICNGASFYFGKLGRRYDVPSVWGRKGSTSKLMTSLSSPKWRLVGSKKIPLSRVSLTNCSTFKLIFNKHNQIHNLLFLLLDCSFFFIYIFNTSIIFCPLFPLFILLPSSRFSSVFNIFNSSFSKRKFLLN